MFKEIASELMSILSDDPVEKIAHMPTKELAKTLELLFDIKFEDVERIYNNKHNDYTTHTVLYKGEKNVFKSNKCFVNGTLRHIILIPVSALDKNENNAIIICKAIISYIAVKINLLNEYSDLFKGNSIANETVELSIPVITTYVMKKLYGGAALPTIVYNTLVSMLPACSKIISVTGIESIINLLDEDLSIETLLDNSFICAIKKDADKYPGIWENKK